MVSPILVTGGTGTLARLVVPRLRDAGRDVRALSQHRREGAEGIKEGIEFVTGDLATGKGIHAAVKGTEIIIHCAGSPKGDEDKARHLVRAARAPGRGTWCTSRSSAPTGSPVVSGIGRAMFGYFAAKLAAERVVADSGLPGILLTIRQLARLPVVPVPAGWRVQPVDADEVAARLVELALGAPAGLVPDLAGPRMYELAALVRGYLRAQGKHRPILPVRLPGRAARAVRAGATLAPDWAVGRRIWEDFLAGRVSAPSHALPAELAGRQSPHVPAPPPPE